MSMTMAVRRLKIEPEPTVHGFRSSFRDWCGEATAFPREVAEAALAHTVGDKVEAAYRRILGRVGEDQIDRPVLGQAGDMFWRAGVTARQPMRAELPQVPRLSPGSSRERRDQVGRRVMHRP